MAPTSAFCEAMADPMTVCEGMGAGTERIVFLDQCESMLADGVDPFGSMTENCQSLYAAIQACSAENAECGDMDENSVCLYEHEAFAAECGR